MSGKESDESKRTVWLVTSGQAHEGHNPREAYRTEQAARERATELRGGDSFIEHMVMEVEFHDR